MNSTTYGREAPLHSYQFFAGLIRRDVARHCTGCDRQRRSQIHLSGTAAPREVAVLRANHHLIGTRGNSRAGVNAGPTTGLDYLRARLLKHIEVALAQTIFTGLLRA